MRTLRLMLLGACLAMVSLALASDLEKERRWADQVVDALLDGEAVVLNDGRADFLGIVTESADGGLGTF